MRIGVVKVAALQTSREYALTCTVTGTMAGFSRHLVQQPSHRVSPMTWKAWIDGDLFDLETLGELFSAGDPLVVQDSSGSYYLQSAALQDPRSRVGLEVAQALVKCVNGAARAIDRSFQPVSLTNRYTAPDGTGHVVVSVDAATARTKTKVVVTVTKNGAPVSQPPPKGPRYVKLAAQDPDVADALRILGQSAPLDWYDIYKAVEIVEHAAGGARQIENRGWAMKADIDRLTASANHPGISGDEARHARMKGTPGANRSMTMQEAEALVRRLVANWIESHPSY